MKLTVINRIKTGFTLLFTGSLPSWWWSDFSNEFYKSKIAHDYKDGKIDYRFVNKWFTDQL